MCEVCVVCMYVPYVWHMEGIYVRVVCDMCV